MSQQTFEIKSRGWLDEKKYSHLPHKESLTHPVITITDLNGKTKDVTYKVTFVECYGHGCGMSNSFTNFHDGYYCLCCNRPHVNKKEKYIVTDCTGDNSMCSLSLVGILEDEWSLNCLCTENTTSRFKITHCGGMKCRNDPNTNNWNKIVHCVSCNETPLTKHDIFEKLT
jgi:hypothetical protein